MKKLKSPAPRACATDDAKWHAVVQKDRNADGKFYFSVKTTGIYCRPSCPARPALRKNVAFHVSPKDAEQAGFRPCKRCSPNGPNLAEAQAAAVAKACRAIEIGAEPPTLNA